MAELCVEPSSVSLTVEWTELLREISLHASYVVKGFAAECKKEEASPDVEWVAGEDDVPLLKRLALEAYGKVTTALRGYLLAEGSCCSPSGDVHVVLAVAPLNDLIEVELLRGQLMQAMAYYVLYRWFMKRAPKQAMWLLALYEDVLVEVKRLLHFRRGGVRRPSVWL